MKLSFTTLGCPQWDLETIIRNAAEYGYDGIDFRGYLGDNDIWKDPLFSTNIQATADAIAAAGLKVPCLSSSIRLLGPEEKDEAQKNEARHYIEMARTFGAAYIRVFGGHLQDAGTDSKEEAAERAAALLDAIAALDRDVSFLVETHDDWVSGADVKLLMETVCAPNTGVIWDIHHPFRYCNEPMQTTWDLIGEWVKYLHIKDSSGDSTAHQLCLPGEGTIAIAEALEIIQAADYNGWLAFEWEKRWHPEIPEPEIAFPLFLELINSLL